MAETCAWTLDDYQGCWDTACGESFVFEDDGPLKNGARFCLYCGGALTEVRPEPELEDDDG